MPDGEWMEMPVESVSVLSDGSARAVVVKDHSDDPDVTRGARIVCTVRLTDGDEVTFAGGEGVGTVTLPGVGIDPGEPAINPVPRAMMTREARRLYPAGGVQITVSVPGGAELTEKTFNPRIGISGGISIIGTSGVVSPFSHEAFVEAMRREMEVAVAMGAERIVLNSGARSERAVKALYPDLPPQAFIHYGNAVGDAVRLAAGLGVGSLTVSMMIGKAVKLAAGNLDTHSHNVTMDRGFLSGLGRGNVRDRGPQHGLRALGSPRPRRSRPVHPRPEAALPQCPRHPSSPHHPPPPHPRRERCSLNPKVFSLAGSARGISSVPTTCNHTNHLDDILIICCVPRGTTIDLSVSIWSRL